MRTILVAILLVASCSSTTTAVARKSQAGRPAAFGDWKYTQNVDPMTDAVSHSAMLLADEPFKTRRGIRRTVLGIQYPAKGGSLVALVFSDHVAIRCPKKCTAMVRLDHQPAFVVPIKVMNSGIVLMDPTLEQKILKSSRMLVQILIAEGTRIIRFTVGGLESRAQPEASPTLNGATL